MHTNNHNNNRPTNDHTNKDRAARDRAASGGDISGGDTVSFPDGADTQRFSSGTHTPHTGQERSGGSGDGDMGKPGRRPNKRIYLAAALTAAAVLMWSFAIGGRDNNTPSGGAEEVALTDVLAMIDDGDVESAALNDDARTITVTTGDDDTYISGYPSLYGTELVNKLSEEGIEVDIEERASEPVWIRFFLSLAPIMFLGLLIVYVMHRFGGARMRSAGNSKAVERPQVRFSDIAGAPEAVEDLSDVVEFLTNPEHFTRLGAQAPRGVLMVGPPGTGKTLLARAVAGEADVPFYSLAGSDFVEMYAGVGAARVRTTFENARKNGPAIVFIDELDSIGKTRGGPSNGATEERESTLNALLVELDGFRESNVVIMGATNRADTLDSALLRPGRFDRHVTVGAPDRAGRTELFELYLNDIHTDTAMPHRGVAEQLAKRAVGMTGADIKNVCNEAALLAVKDNSDAVTEKHLHSALERVAMGRERTSAVVSERARTVTAWHEAGHAVCALKLEDASAPQRVSIVPRGQAGGVTWLEGGDDEHFITRTECEAALAVAFGGRAAEEVVLAGNYTQGAASDIAAATDRAEKMVCEWGMSNLGVARIDTTSLIGEPAEQVRAAINGLLDTAMNTARRTLSEHAELLAEIADALLEHETLDRDDLEKIVARVEQRHTADSETVSDAA